MMHPGPTFMPPRWEHPEWWCKVCGYRWMGARQTNIAGIGIVLGYWCEKCRRFFPINHK